MSWTLHLQPIRNPWSDEALLAGGRGLYVAQAFEEKCLSLLRFAYLIEALDSDPVARLEELIESVPKDRLLKRTLDELARLHPAAKNQTEALSQAREARNYIAHEGLRFGIHDMGAFGLVDSLVELRRQVQLLATGDNLVSTWSFWLHERNQPTSLDLVNSYESMIDSWVFEPVWELVEPSSSD